MPHAHALVRTLALDDTALPAEQIERLHEAHHRHVDRRVGEQRDSLGDLRRRRCAKSAEDLTEDHRQSRRHLTQTAASVGALGR